MAALLAPATRNATCTAALITGKVKVKRCERNLSTYTAATQCFGFLQRRAAGKERCRMAVFAQTEQDEVEARQSRSRKIFSAPIRRRRPPRPAPSRPAYGEYFPAAVGCDRADAPASCGSCYRDGPGAHSVRPPRKDARAANRRDRGTLRREENRAPPASSRRKARRQTAPRARPLRRRAR